MMTAEDPGLQKCGVWTVHSDTEGRPMLRGFAKSKPEAEALLAKLKADEQEAEFWLVELTHNELEDFKQFGMLPAEF
jgi:hypothetical protein